MLASLVILTLVLLFLYSVLTRFFLGIFTAEPTGWKCFSCTAQSGDDPCVTDPGKVTSSSPTVACDKEDGSGFGWCYIVREESTAIPGLNQEFLAIKCNGKIMWISCPNKACLPVCLLTSQSGRINNPCKAFLTLLYEQRNECVSLLCVWLLYHDKFGTHFTTNLLFLYSWWSGINIL